MPVSVPSRHLFFQGKDRAEKKAGGTIALMWPTYQLTSKVKGSGKLVNFCATIRTFLSPIGGTPLLLLSG